MVVITEKDLGKKIDLWYLHGELSFSRYEKGYAIKFRNQPKIFMNKPMGRILFDRLLKEKVSDEV